MMLEYACVQILSYKFFDILEPFKVLIKFLFSCTVWIVVIFNRKEDIIVFIQFIKSHLISGNSEGNSVGGDISRSTSVGNNNSVLVCIQSSGV